MTSSFSASLSPTTPCPCGRLDARRKPLAYGDCCARYVEQFDTQPAPDAESLMRSRYTAFVLQRGPYLQATWDAAHRPATLDFDSGTRWLGLDVRARQAIDAEHAEVEFVARYRESGGRAHRIHERSRFTRHSDGRWYYVDGDQR